MLCGPLGGWQAELTQKLAEWHGNRLIRLESCMVLSSVRKGGLSVEIPDSNCDSNPREQLQPLATKPGQIASISRRQRTGADGRNRRMTVSKTVEANTSCGFDPRLRHQIRF